MRGLANQRVACWGDNGEGQLGDGSTNAERLLPTLVADGTGLNPLEGVLQVSAGDAHTCARLANEQVRCWGTNDIDQLGDGSNVGSNLPVPVSVPGGGGPLPGVAQIDAGDAHTCARLFAGAVVCGAPTCTAPSATGPIACATYPSSSATKRAPASWWASDG